jgi:hypothetical protein
MAFSSYGTLQFWLDASQEVHAEGAGVSAWTDRGGAGRSFTGDGGGLPIMRRTAFRGRPAIYFDGTLNRRFYRTTGGVFPAAYTVLLAIQFASTTPSGGTNKFLWDSDWDNQVSRHFCQWISTGSIMLGIDGGGGNFSIPAGRIVAGKPSVLSATYNGSSSELRLDLVNVATGTLTTTTASGPASYFASSQASVGAGVFHLAEVVAYTAPLSTVNLVAATKELMAKHQISVPGVVVG